MLGCMRALSSRPSRSAPDGDEHVPANSPRRHVKASALSWASRIVENTRPHGGRNNVEEPEEFAMDAARGDSGEGGSLSITRIA